METVWFIAVALMITVYVLLDGFDLGAGAIHPFVAKGERERRLVLRSIGPVWDGNEVWIIAAGGTLFFAFPLLYASGFSGFYLPLFVVLWLLIIRGLSIELRGHIENPLWASFWDAGFFLGSALLAVFFGVALGNVVRGVPLNEDGDFFQPLWTDFNPFSENPGIIDPYTVLIGVLALTTLIVHGANWIALKTEDELNARALRFSRAFSLALVLLTAVATPATFWVSPWMLESFSERPYGYVLPLVAAAGLAGTVYFAFRGRDRAAFLSSGAYIVGMLTSTVFAVYPNVLPAVDPRNSLTIFNAASSDYSQAVGLVWWSIGMALAAVYFVVIYRLFRGKVRLEDEGY
ncbi:cytochrome d ubiquinol oxidase subunit II [Rubrobacter marinus]|uniref:Cytochrome d ubiquinol oxidase subunit II n=1 Tax=Rubrobacter marinus TaxID=2653852 RepID=A0A6G8PW38_9ACTN|nr:cytochrome d ubiquinol oxidase subunit II [Rubrobacter marinus]QIN78420.1 cytochrome d ubiquinol oxidase subunit II [Rubrobacter marinus]